MRKIYFLHKHLIKLGDVIEHNGFRATVTEELIELNPELFVVKDSIQELLDKAKRDYPIGTMLNSKYGRQKVLSDKPFMGRVTKGTVQINTDQFPGGMTIYTPEDGWCEILPLKFTTEDGVDIYGDMKTFLIHPNDSVDIFFNHSSWNGDSYLKGYKYFYHKENALAYIKKHKEKTLEDYENSLSLSVWGWFKIHEPKLYYTKILQLIADDLNDGWEPDSTNHNEKKWFITKETIDFNYHIIIQSVVYFKLRDLAQKARDILGDKVNYLLN